MYPDRLEQGVVTDKNTFSREDTAAMFGCLTPDFRLIRQYLITRGLLGEKNRLMGLKFSKRPLGFRQIR